MSSQPPVRTKKDDDSRFSDTPPKHQNLDQTRVDIYDDTRASQRLKKEEGGFFFFLRKFRRSLKSLIVSVPALIGACLGVALFGLFVDILCSGYVIAVVVFMLILLVSLFVTRMIQFIRHGDNYDRAIRFKLFIRASMYLVMGTSLPIPTILYAITKHTPSLKYVTFIGVSVSKWLVIYSIIFGIYILNLFLSLVIHGVIPIVPLDHSESKLNVSENVLEIVECLTSWLAVYEVFKRVPALKHDKILGLHTRKWIEVPLFFLVAYNIISLFTRLIVWLFKLGIDEFYRRINKKSTVYSITEKTMHLRYLLYCVNGIKYSIDFVLRSLLLLLIWVLYFGHHLDAYGTSLAKNVVDIGTSTCVSLLVCSLLWVIKTCLLLSWEAGAVYNRLERNITDGAKQLYFLGIIGRHNYDIFNLRYDSRIDPDETTYFRIFGVVNIDSDHQSHSDIMDRWVGKEEEGGSDNNDPENNNKLSTKKIEIVKADLLLLGEDRLSTMFDLQQAAHYFLEPRDKLKEEKYTTEILQKFNSWNNSSDQEISDNGMKNRKFATNIYQLIGAGTNNTDVPTKESSGNNTDDPTKKSGGNNTDGNNTDDPTKESGGNNTDDPTKESSGNNTDGSNTDDPTKESGGNDTDDPIKENGRNNSDDPTKESDGSNTDDATKKKDDWSYFVDQMCSEDVATT